MPAPFGSLRSALVPACPPDSTVEFRPEDVHLQGPDRRPKPHVKPVAFHLGRPRRWERGGAPGTFGACRDIERIEVEHGVGVKGGAGVEGVGARGVGGLGRSG